MPGECVDSESLDRRWRVPRYPGLLRGHVYGDREGRDDGGTILGSAVPVLADRLGYNSIDIFGDVQKPKHVWICGTCLNLQFPFTKVVLKLVPQKCLLNCTPVA